MYRITIKNLETFPREIQFYKINRYMVLSPFNQTTVECNDYAEMEYYKALGNKKFDVNIEIDIPSKPEVVQEAPQITQKAETSKVIETINEEVDVTEDDLDAYVDTDILYDNTPDTQIILEPSVEINEDVKIKEVTEVASLEDLTDDQLKEIIKKLGIKTSVRARQKLIDLINVNLPDDADLSDYL